jgi:threonine 3-dehydrogenase
LGEDVLITGAGPIGLMAAAVAKHAGARFVVVTDINEHRLKLAQKMGATVAVDTRTTSLEQVQQELGMHEGFDVGLEMSGNPSALHEMIQNMAHGAKIAILGIPTDDVEVDLTTVIFNMLTIKGIYGREMYETWYAMTIMLQTGLDISPVITDRFAANDFEAAFASAMDRRSGKVLLDWTAVT